MRSSAMGPQVRKVTAFAAVTMAAALGAFVYQAHQIGQVSGTPYVVGFPTEGAVNVMLAQGDGQAFAALATDPGLNRPEQFAGQTADSRLGVEAAYRAQRPLLGYLAWVTSFGRPNLVNPALLAWQLIGATAAVAAVSALLVQRGSNRPALALATLILPGSVLAASWLGPELLGIGLAFGAWLLLPHRFWAGIALLVSAALVRETMLLVPGVLGLSLLLRRDIVRAAAMAIPFIVFGAWLLVVHARFDAWPSEANEGRLGPPLQGLLESAGQMSTVDIAFAVVNIALLAVAWRYRRDPLAWLIAASSAMAVLAGWDVWLNRGAINRVMLPAHVALLVLLMTGVHDPFDGNTEEGSAADSTHGGALSEGLPADAGSITR